MNLISDLHIFGWQKENELKEILESELNLTLTKTEDRYDTKDYITSEENHFAELKSRTQKYSRHEFSHWVIPTRKFWDLEKGQKMTVFYYWEQDNSLWKLEYDYKLFKTFNRGVPDWHYEVHFWIPAQLWQRCNFQPSAQAWLGESEICNQQILA